MPNKALSRKPEEPQISQTQPATPPPTQPTPSSTLTSTPGLAFSILDDDKALKRVAALDWGNSPFDILLTLTPGVIAPRHVSAPRTPLTLQAIYSGTRGNIAKINGLLLRVGDTIADATVTSISLKRRLVEVQREDGSIYPSRLPA